MNIYDLTKKYGTGQGEGAMWKTIEVISDAIERTMPEADQDALARKVYGVISGEHYNEEFAKEDIAKMYYVMPGGEKVYAPYWSEEALRTLYKRYKDQIPGYNCWDWMVTMTMMKSDYCPLIMAWFPNLTEDEKNERIVQLSLNWLKDEDNPFGSSKTWGYLNSK